MNIDMSALRIIERERDIDLNTIVEAIESALLTAYKHSGGQPHGRVEVDRKSGAATVWAQEVDESGAVVREWDD
ncbi:MAG: NusA N-terminal domain-containing protein, partial [Pseudonocardiales bacterium]